MNIFEKLDDIAEELLFHTKCIRGHELNLFHAWLLCCILSIPIPILLKFPWWSVPIFSLICGWPLLVCFMLVGSAIYGIIHLLAYPTETLKGIGQFVGLIALLIVGFGLFTYFYDIIMRIIMHVLHLIF